MHNYVNKYVRLALLLASMIITGTGILPLYAIPEDDQGGEEKEAAASVVASGLGDAFTFPEDSEFRDVNGHPFNNTDNALRVIVRQWNERQPRQEMRNGKKDEWYEAIFYAAVCDGGVAYKVTIDMREKKYKKIVNVTPASSEYITRMVDNESGKEQWHRIPLEGIFTYERLLFRVNGDHTLRNQLGMPMSMDEKEQPDIRLGCLMFKDGHTLFDEYYRPYKAYLLHGEKDPESESIPSHVETQNNSKKSTQSKPLSLYQAFKPQDLPVYQMFTAQATKTVENFAAGIDEKKNYGSARGSIVLDKQSSWGRFAQNAVWEHIDGNTCEIETLKSIRLKVIGHDSVNKRIYYGIMNDDEDIYELTTDEHGAITNVVLMHNGYGCFKWGHILDNGKYRQVVLEPVRIYGLDFYREQGKTVLRSDSGAPLETAQAEMAHNALLDILRQKGAAISKEAVTNNEEVVAVDNEEIADDKIAVDNVTDPREKLMFRRIRAITDTVMGAVERLPLVGERCARRYFEHSRGQEYKYYCTLGDAVIIPDEADFEDIDNQKFDNGDNALKRVGRLKIDGQDCEVGAVKKGGLLYTLVTDNNGTVTEAPSHVFVNNSNEDDDLVYVLAHGNYLCQKEENDGVLKNIWGDKLVVTNGQPLKCDGELVFERKHPNKTEIVYVNINGRPFSSLSPKNINWLPTIKETKHPIPMVLSVLTGTMGAGLLSGVAAVKLLKKGYNKITAKRNRDKQESESNFVASEDGQEAISEEQEQEEDGHVAQQVETDVALKEEDAQEFQSQEHESVASVIDTQEQLEEFQEEMGVNKKSRVKKRPKSVRAHVVQLMRSLMARVTA